MTETKEQKVTYDANFKTYEMTSSSTASTGVLVPRDVKIVYWIFFKEAKSSGRVATINGSGNPSFASGSKTLSPGGEYIYNSYTIWSDYNLFGTIKEESGTDVHAYAVYAFASISVKVYYASTKVHVNDFSRYVEDTTILPAQTYGSFTYPSSVPGQTSAELIGFCISANHYDGGELTRGSVTSYQVNDTWYTANKNTTALWGYSTTEAKNQEDPTFYLYAVYNDKISTSNTSYYDVSVTSSKISINTTGVFQSGHKYKITVRGFESTNENDYTHLFIGTQSAAGTNWENIKPHVSKTTSKYTATAVVPEGSTDYSHNTTLEITFTASSYDSGYYLNFYFSKLDGNSQGGIGLASILDDMEILINEIT